LYGAPAQVESASDAMRTLDLGGSGDECTPVAAAAAAGSPDTTTGGSGAGGKWLKADFVAECGRRGLPTSGTMAELQARLGL
jgi:hypothetical protein